MSSSLERGFVAATVLILGTCSASLAGAQTILTLPPPRPLTFAPSIEASSHDAAAATTRQSAQAASFDLTDVVAPDPQDPAPEPTKPTRGFVSALVQNLGDDIKHLPRRNSLYFLLGGGAAALAVHPADESINRHLLGSSFADAFFAPGKYVGATEVQIGASFTTYILGRVRHQPRVQHLGMDLLEAQILTEGIVEGAKVMVRRDRPLNPDGTRYPGYSFPSGHAAVTFASATVLQQHLGWKAAVPTYVLATYVATSRLHDNRHFASDVVFGAATGIVVGRSVTWHGRNDWHLSMAALPGGLGGIIKW
jgi:membrane-associated phospholipid phosphatase